MLIRTIIGIFSIGAIISMGLWCTQAMYAITNAVKEGSNSTKKYTRRRAANRIKLEVKRVLIVSLASIVVFFELNTKANNDGYIVLQDILGTQIAEAIETWVIAAAMIVISVTTVKGIKQLSDIGGYENEYARKQIR